jgi:hypothetical protein
VLAEGLPAETFLDTGNRIAFANNGDGSVQLYPNFDLSGNDNYLLWGSLAYAPLVVVGEVVERAREQLRAQESILRARAEAENFTNTAAQRLPAAIAKKVA